MIQCSVPILGFCAFSGTGKTTLLTQLIPQLKAGGVRLGVIKHAHHGFDIDHPMDVTSLDTFLIVVGGVDKRWIVSNANDALTWAANEVIETDVRVGDLIGVEQLDNNLFIFDCV